MKLANHKELKGLKNLRSLNRLKSLNVQTFSNPFKPFQTFFKHHFKLFQTFIKPFSLSPFLFCLFFFIFSLLPSPVSAQELSNVGKGPIVTIDGGVSMNQIWSWSDVPSNYRKPFAYTLSANLNFSLYGWSIPLSAVYSNQNWSYQQPFNQFSLSPTYKWIRTHIGYSSMSFSTYTLSGHQFLGGGVELTPPGKWKFSAMAGRMQRLVLPDSAGRFDPAYYRFGSGFKTEYTSSFGNIGISMFYAKDDPKSLAAYVDTLKIAPQENLATSIDGNFTLWQKFTVNFEYGTSMITEDTRFQSTGEKFTMMPALRKNLTSHQYHAFKTMFSYNSTVGSFGVGVERVDPGYNTLGAYYMNNDFVNYTFNYAGRIKDKVTFSLSSGLQKDDLNGNKSQQTKRLVNSAMVGFAPSQVVNLNVMYSNFSNYTNVRTGFENINTTSPYGNIDTLDYTQISQTTGINLNISPKATETYRQNISFSANYQQASQAQKDNPDQSGSRFYNGMAGYNGSLLKPNLSFSTNFNYSRSIADSITTVIYGPTLSARKGLFDKKMNVSLSVSYNASNMNSKPQSGVWIFRLGSGYTIGKHNFDLGAVLANRNNTVKKVQTNDVTVTFTYRYSFSAFKKKQTTTKSE